MVDVIVPPPPSPQWYLLRHLNESNVAGDNSSVVVCVPAPEGMIYPPLRLKWGGGYECAAPARRYDGGGLLYGVIFKLRLLITQVPSPRSESEGVLCMVDTSPGH